ncbi:hypothetical protein [Leptothrix sp. BB-3]
MQAAAENPGKGSAPKSRAARPIEPNARTGTLPKPQPFNWMGGYVFALNCLMKMIPATLEYQLITDRLVSDLI